MSYKNIIITGFNKKRAIMMMGVLDAEKVLSDLRSGKSISDKIYFITFDTQKTSQNDLSELKSRCARLGYSFNNVEIYQSHEKNSQILFYLVRNLPNYSRQLFKEYSLTDEALV